MTAARSSIAGRSAALIIRESKESLLGLFLCLMSPLSGCNVILDPNSQDRVKRGTRGVCPNCYQVAWQDVNDRLYTWEELVDAGLCRPVRRDLSKRVLKTVLAYRKAS